MIKPLVSKTKWSSLLARTRTLILYFSIWIFDFGPEMLPGLSRNGPQAKLTTDKPRASVQVGQVERYREYCIQQIRRGHVCNKKKKKTICWFFLSSAFLQKRIRIRQFATSKKMMIRQKATVPPIFRAVKWKQLQDPLDPFAVAFMLRFVKSAKPQHSCLKWVCIMVSVINWP